MTTFTTFAQKHLSVDFQRLAKLLGIVLGVITLVAMIAFVGLAEWPLVSAILWHIQHGSSAAMEGHLFRIPLLYEPEVSKDGRQIDIIQYPRLLSGTASVTLESNPKAFDSQSVNQWQALLMSGGNKHPDIFRSTPVTLHGKRLTFVCVDLVFIGGESLLCQAAGTTLSVSTTASPTHIEETRTILETSD